MPCTGGRELGKLKTKAKYLVMAVSENCQRLCYAKERKGKQKKKLVDFVIVQASKLVL
jgi:hypothetical protein